MRGNVVVQDQMDVEVPPAPRRRSAAIAAAALAIGGALYGVARR
ncbi:hypothetical protein OH805_37960 [Streptomyces sp. NBC_00879]|nr:hypothetical protein OH805_37960 [Streptomyces sp. NBC_00879]